VIRVRVEFGIRSTSKLELWFTLYNLEDYDLILGKPWFCQHNLKHTIDYVENMMYSIQRTNVASTYWKDYCR
jgi:hypothetical protein